MSNRFSSTALVALAAVFSFTALAPSSAQARQEHWFYNDYDRYDEDAYGNDDVVYDNGYRTYEPSRRELRRLKRQRKKARRQRNQQRRYTSTRPGRQRLYDAWQGSYPQPAPVIMTAPPAPRFQQPQQQVDPRLEQRPFRLSYVPLPRRKPYHLIPPVQASTEQPVATISLDRDSEPLTFDQRPRWNPTPERSTKKAIEVTRLPKASPSAAAIEKRVTLNKPLVKKAPGEKVKQAFKPVRIEVTKARKHVTPVRKPVPLAKPPRSKPRLAANQLSCNKAKSIVSGFGFSDITPRICTGNVYDFNAKRDGKPYSIKVSSLSGELKDVKKIK